MSCFTLPSALPCRSPYKGPLGVDASEGHEVQQMIDKWEGKSWPMGSVERFAFYDKARKAYAVIVTGETRFYGCFILKKGVIPPKG